VNAEYRRVCALLDRRDRICKEAERVMGELKAVGGDWQQAWKDHPVAVAYRALLREAWEGR
jgi:hypothetical protein